MRKRRTDSPALVSQTSPPDALMIWFTGLRSLDCEDDSGKAEGQQEHHTLEQRDVVVIVEQGLEEGEHDDDDGRWFGGWMVVVVCVVVCRLVGAGGET